MLVSVKNTFIDVSSEIVQKEPLRCQSCPPRQRENKHIEHDVEEDMAVYQLEQRQSLKDNVFSTFGNTTRMEKGHYWFNAVKHDDVEQHKDVYKVHSRVSTKDTCYPTGDETITTEDGEDDFSAVSQMNQERRHRPCKGKRLRYRKLVERLKVEIRKQAPIFRVEEISWPPSLQEDTRKRQKLMHTLTFYQRKVLQDPSLNLENLA